MTVFLSQSGENSSLAAANDGTVCSASSGNPDDSNPRISWGKYVTVNGRTTLPVSLFVNHALADGLHISRFYQKLEEELAALTRQWNESKKDF